MHMFHNKPPHRETGIYTLCEKCVHLSIIFNRWKLSAGLHRHLHPYMHAYPTHTVQPLSSIYNDMYVRIIVVVDSAHLASLCVMANHIWAGLFLAYILHALQ